MKTAKDVDKYVGNRLKIKRMEKGLSQNDIGKIVGITFQQIQKYEKGVNRIGSGRLYEFAQILGVPMSYFFEDFDIFSNINIENKSFDKNISKLIGNFNKIKDKDGKKIVLDFVSLILKLGL